MEGIPVDSVGRSGFADRMVNDVSVVIDEILARLRPDQRDALQAVRETIVTSAPAAVEALSYGAPAFRYRGRPLIAYAAAKAHCAIYPMSPNLIVLFRDELEGFETSKGAIRFIPARPVPASVITRLVQARMAEIDATAS